MRAKLLIPWKAWRCFVAHVGAEEGGRSELASLGASRGDLERGSIREVRSDPCAFGGKGQRGRPRVFLRLSEYYFRKRRREIKKPSLCREEASGKAFLEPSDVSAGQGPVTLTLRFRCGEGGIRSGGGIKVFPARVVDFGGGARRAVPLLVHGWGRWQTRYPWLPNYVSVRVDPSSGAEVSVRRMGFFPLRGILRYVWWSVARRRGAELPPFDLLYHLLEEGKVQVKVVKGALKEGEEVRLVIGDRSRGGRGWKVPFRAATLDLAVEVDEKGTGEYRLIGNCPRVRALGGKAEGLEAVLKAEGSVGARLVVRAVDAKGDTAFAGFAGGIQVLDETGKPLGRCLLEDGQGVGELRLQVPVGHRVHVKAEGRPLTAVSNPLPPRWMGMRLFWGDLHAHSVICDGTLEPREFYRWAREEAALDFAAITTHDNMARFEPSGRQEEWMLMRRLAEEFTEPGAFVVLLGYEWSSHSRGHRGVFYAPGEPDPQVFSSLEGDAREVRELEEALGNRMALVVPHHTAWRKVFFVPWNWSKFIRLRIPERYTWGEREGRLQRLVEIYSDHGSSESPDPSFPITHGRPRLHYPRFMREDGCREGLGNYVREAWAAGYRLGVVAGSDRHDYPLDPAVYSVPVHPRGLTGLWAEELTPEAVWSALWNRHVYGTTGARMVVQLEADGLPMGSEYLGRRPPHIRGMVWGVGKIRAELWRHDRTGYRILWLGEGEGEISLDLVDEDASGGVFYYIRAQQEDGHKAWSSPIWVELP